MSQQHRVLLTGATHHPEFARILARLKRATQVKEFSRLAAAAEYLQQPAPLTHLILIATARPGAYRAAEVERLHLASPLSRMVALLGSWCEGEDRTGRPWPGVQRVYWYQWDDRWTAYAGGQLASWDLGRTATAQERILIDQRARHLPGTPTCGIVSRSAAMASALSDMLASWGGQPLWIRPGSQPPHPPLSVVFWDGESLRAGNQVALQQLVQQVAPAPVVALIGFPRLSDIEAAFRCGARAVHAKPWQEVNLWTAVRQLLGDQRDTGPSRGAA